MDANHDEEETEKTICVDNPAQIVRAGLCCGVDDPVYPPKRFLRRRACSLQDRHIGST